MAQQINLYDATLERQRDWLALGNVVAVTLLLAVIVGALGVWARAGLPQLNAQSTSSDTQLKALREQVTTLGQQVANRKADARLEQEIATKRQVLALRGDVLATLLASLGPKATSYTETLRGFARQSVPGLWLTGFVLQPDGGMEISGAAIDTALLPEYIRRLNQEVAFQGKTFATLKLDRNQPAPAAASTKAKAGEPPAAAAPTWHEFVLAPKRDGNAPAAPGKGGI